MNSVAAILGSITSAEFSNSKTIDMKSDVIRQLFWERYSTGVPYRDICRELGISKRTAGNWAREMALPRRRGGPRLDRWSPEIKPKIA
jgi:hypothetical protein